jgi:hypothetical protein
MLQLVAKIGNSQYATLLEKSLLASWQSQRQAEACRTLLAPLERRRSAERLVVINISLSPSETRVSLARRR